MNSERNVSPSGCAWTCWRDLDGQFADASDDRLQGGDERQDDLASRGRLELLGTALGAAAQPLEQLAGGFAARVAVSFEERVEALLAQATGIGRRRVAAQERQRNAGVHRAEHLGGARPEACELVAQLVSQRDPGAHQALPRSGRRAQRLGLVAVRHQDPEAMAVGPRELGQHKAVKDIALAARDGIARAHRLDLVGVHRHHRQASVQQTLDQQTVRPLQRNQSDLQPDQPRAQRP